MLKPPSGSPYQTLMVWLKDDRVTRIVAHHAQVLPGSASPRDLAKILREAWGLESPRLGWPSRQEFDSDGQLRALIWQDDALRVRMGWQYSQHGPPRLYSEWVGFGKG